MTQQDQTQKWSNNGGGGGAGAGGGGGLGRSSSKKAKQKKLPQRGLGVAQLEKIRIEEQQRKEATLAVSSSSSKSFLPLQQLPSFHHSNQPSSFPISLHPGTPVDFLRLPHSLQNLDAARASSCTVPSENTGNFDSTTWPSNIIQVHGHHQNVPRLCDFEKDFVSSMSLNLPYESNHTWPPSNSNWTQRTQQFQQLSSSMVNVSSGNLTSPLYHCSKEPPSNQNYSSSCVPMRPEEKMINLKRSYPFSLDVPTASSFNFKSPAFTANVKANESTSRAYGNFGATASSSSAFRVVVPSCSTASSSAPNSSKKNENFKGDFLSLAPPISHPKSKSPSTFPAFHHNHQELPHFQGTEEDQIGHGQQQCLHSFFPAKEAAESDQTRETKKEEGNCNGEKGESVDLNLKL